MTDKVRAWGDPPDPDDVEPVAYDGFGAPIYPHQEDPMPTDLPPGFTGTGKPRSTPNPKIPVEVNIPSPRPIKDEDYIHPAAKVIALLVMTIGSWLLVGGVIWVVKHLVEFAIGLTS